MKNVIKWESYDEVILRIAKKKDKNHRNPGKLTNDQTCELQQDTPDNPEHNEETQLLSDCGGLPSEPVLPPDEEE